VGHRGPALQRRRRRYGGTVQDLDFDAVLFVATLLLSSAAPSAAAALGVLAERDRPRRGARHEMAAAVQPGALCKRTKYGFGHDKSKDGIATSRGKMALPRKEMIKEGFASV
jgi:hypothetical protein